MKSYQRWVQEDPGFSPNYIYGGVMAVINSALSICLYYSQNMWVFLSIAIGSVVVLAFIMTGKPGRGDWVLELSKFKFIPREILIGAGIVSVCFLILFTALPLFSFYSLNY